MSLFIQQKWKKQRVKHSFTTSSSEVVFFKSARKRLIFLSCRVTVKHETLLTRFCFFLKYHFSNISPTKLLFDPTITQTAQKISL